MALKKILVVEDEPALREILLEMLEGEGFTCTGAANGFEATQILSREAMDLVVTDFRMPKMNGVALLNWCRENKMHFPVIFVTATEELELDEKTALGDCCADLIRKPVSMDMLLEAVHKAEERNHQRFCH